MRPHGDYTPDEVLKSDWCDEYRLVPRGARELPDDKPVALVFDDRDKVVRMWRERGFRCLQVAPGNF